MMWQFFLLAVFSLTLFAANAHADEVRSSLAEANVAVNNKDFQQAGEILTGHLEHEPNDTEARLLLARVLSWQKKWDDALEHFNVLLAATPDNVDSLLARANTYEWMGHRQKALQDLENARKLSPYYSEIWRTELIILLRDNKMESKHQASALVVEAKQKFPDVDWDDLMVSKDTKTIAPNNYAVAVSYGHDELTNDRSPWEIASAMLTMQTPDKHFAHVQLDTIERFDLDDWQIGGSYALPLSPAWGFYTAGSYSPTHKVIANRILEARVSKSFSTGINLYSGLKHARYSETSSKQLYLTGEYYWSSFRVSYTYRLIDVLNAGTGNNHNIQLNKYYSAANMVGVSVAAGEDVEFDGTLDPAISDVVTFSLYGHHMFRPRWSLTYSFIYHQQGDFYNRNGFILGIKFDY